MLFLVMSALFVDSVELSEMAFTLNEAQNKVTSNCALNFLVLFT